MNPVLFIRFDKRNINAYASLLEAMPAEIAGRLSVHFAPDWDTLIAKCQSDLAPDSQLIIPFSVRSLDILEIPGQIQRLKKEIKQPLICVAGGPHITGDPLAVAYLGFDYGIVGEGEISFWQFMAAFIDETSLQDIAGLIYRAGPGILRINGYSPRPEATQITSFSARYSLFGPIELTRGCPNRCRFCQTNRIFRGGIRHIPFDQVMRNLEYLAFREVQVVRFLSPDSSTYQPDPSRPPLPQIEDLLRTARTIIGPRREMFFGTFPSEIRPEHVSDDLIKIIRHFTHDTYILIGAQSGSDAHLDRMQRGHSAEDVLRAVAIIKRHDVQPMVDFIFGLPEETLADVRESIALMQKITAMGGIIHSHTYLPLPGTDYFDQEYTEIPAELKQTIALLCGRKQSFGQWQSQDAMRVRIKAFVQEQHRLIRQEWRLIQASEPS
jgi:B12-binding domain/radical SAM domain protein